MNHPPQQPNACPQCRAVLPTDAPQGLCPACLLAAVALPTEAGTAAPAKAPPPTREQVAAAFPQLEILELIGAGGMGYVFKARQPKLDRLVALKLLPQSLAADPAFAGRFEREGRILARLSHSNIVTVHDFGFAPIPRAGDLQSPSLSTLNPQLSTSQTGFYYLLMEFVDGVNLRQAMRAGRFTPLQALEVVPKICEALQFAHEQGILHRDIKPENILLDARGRVKLVDFGIAKLLDADNPADKRSAGLRPGSNPPDDADTPGRRPALHASLTSATAALGTPSYMAPEQRDRPADVDHRADIYSLGVVFYEMLTGELPVGKFAPPSAKSASDPRVDEVVLRALEQQRERRQQSAGEVKTQVETIASSPGSSRREEAPIPRPLPADQAIEPPAQLGFFRRSLGWGVFLGVLATLGLIVGVTMLIGGTALSEWLKTSSLFSKQKPPPAAHAPAATTTTPAKATPAKPVPDLSAKQITFRQITNLNGHPYLTSHTLLAPGESFQGWLVLPDGSRERASSSESVFSHGGKESGICGWTWLLPSPFSTNHADEVVTQLRARWQDKLVACPPGQPVTMFTLTNEAGVKISGEVQFNRTTVDPDKPAVAEVRARNQMTSLLFFTSQVPDGFALRIRATGTEAHAAHPTLSRSSSKFSDDAHCSWHWMDFEFRGELSAAAAKQMQALFAQGPLLVTNGQPRTVFSVTNAAGKVYSGQFELRGPGFVPPPVPASLPRPLAALSIPSALPPLPPSGFSADLRTNPTRPSRVPMSLTSPPDLRPTEPAKPSSPEATALLTKLRQQYANATNLIVEGHTFSVQARPDRPDFVLSNHFAIKLARPSLYRVAWTHFPAGNPPSKGAAWSDGDGNWSWTQGDALIRDTSRKLALGRNVSTTSFVTAWLPELFFGEAPWISVLRELRIEKVETVDDEPCTVLVGTTSNYSGNTRSYTTRLWVSNRDTFLRRAEHTSTVTAEQVDQFAPVNVPVGTTFTTRQNYRLVVTGQTMTTEDFKFTPPADK